MRVVLYDDETLEALTVLSLPGWVVNEWPKKDPWQIPVPPSWKAPQPFDPNRKYFDEPIETVTIWFEEMRRGRQRTVMAFTRDAENSLRLTSVFLPGQQKEVREAERMAEAKALTDLLSFLIKGTR